MPTDISPKQVQEAAHRGSTRLSNFRKARVMFLRNYVGQYYDRENGEIGTEALGLIFNAIRALVPHIVMNFPKFNVETPYLQLREYAELLGLTVDQHSIEIDVKAVYRRVLVDSIFTLGVFKTGLAESDTLYAIDDGDRIDAGTVYTEGVDFDNFVVDPNSREHMFRDARFMGDRVYIPRIKLLDSGLAKNDLVERLPRMGVAQARDKAYELSMQGIQIDENFEMEDIVEIMELWVPGANATIWVPGSKDVVLDDYLRVDDFYGPKNGPYTLLSLTPPVPGNPLPVPMVGIWNDLHILSNRMAKKIVDQAMRQKDIIAYRRSAADDAEEMREAKDGESVASDDPDGVQIKSFGGQQNSNEMHLAQLQMWFNYMAANPDALAGLGMNANSATQTQVLAGNASVGLEDMRDLVYQAAAKEGGKRAWYFHVDPLIDKPLVRRRQMPAQYMPGVSGPILVTPAQIVEQQVYLTPEARRGDFLNFAFSVEPESMGRKDSRTRFAQALDFATKILPAAASAAQAMAMMGVPFSPKEYIIRMAKDAGIDWMAQVFFDPEFQMQMAMRLMAGPQAGESKGQEGPPAVNPDLSTQMMMQNGQPANVGAGSIDPMEQMMSEFQDGANQGQAELKNGGMY